MELKVTHMMIRKVKEIKIKNKKQILKVEIEVIQIMSIIKNK